jgi:TrpR-related protein YerC/YecD
MRLSKKKINSRIAEQIFNLLYQVAADIHSPQEARDFFEDILTKTELEAMAKRLAIAHYLERGRTYSNIKNSLGISSATIAKIQEQMAKGKGYIVALKKIRAEEWADKWTERISRMMGKGRK